MDGISTAYGILKPQYEDDGARRKYIKPVTYYENGELKSIELQNQEKIETIAGIIPAEHVIFYPSGNIKRIFPLNGKLTGFWTEENEFELAETLSFEFPFGSIETKVIGVYFYDGGGIKSITIWPFQRLFIESPKGPIHVRIGVSMYEDGSLKSCEPVEPTLIPTPIGSIIAYDSSAIGINADVNSLKFDSQGNVIGIVTSVNQIEVKDESGSTQIFEPMLKPSLFNPDKMDIVPLSITFYDDKVRLEGNMTGEYSIVESHFAIKIFANKHAALCSDCSNCTACN